MRIPGHTQTLSSTFAGNKKQELLEVGRLGRSPDELASGTALDGRRENHTIPGERRVRFGGSEERPATRTLTLNSPKYGAPREAGQRSKLVPAGGAITNLEDVRKLTRGNCKALEQYVANVKGRIPIFGYPLMAYSPPGSGVTLTDRKAWRVGMLADGTIEREE